ncbi:bifunctional precorrin-2 dehydrogenase/sirohydrochlorin ferrochelatase MET8 [Ascoidea rubescens DSM 1968]|uniref:precorrin-2 dehydrogenase n=1 Tax=Ascoidea rubescens DSM 1968 TaxID=1344418 RepID=A0A1D2VMJ8_9ASCO|nr:siroheme synthase middle domains-like protein [Ascoidea rubescens DSM 1968]ODV62775.1 siroheme synthase middle domains-like protein [Ascoidea rubescens DSM 1968]
MEEEFPEIQPDGSLLLAWQVKDRPVLVVGGGDVAASRVYHLLNANAKVTVVAPKISREIQHRYENNQLFELVQREFEDEDLTRYENDSEFQRLTRQLDAPDLSSKQIDELDSNIENYIKNHRFALILTAIDDPIKSKYIYLKAKLNNFVINVADRPKNCDFYFGSIYRNNYLQILISSNGRSPRLTRLINDKILKPNLEKEGVDFNKIIDNLGYIRNNLKTIVGQNNKIKERMEWIKNLTDSYTFEEWSKFEKKDLDNFLLEGKLQLLKLE